MGCCGHFGAGFILMNSFLSGGSYLFIGF